jgi:hypothetical protein
MSRIMIVILIYHRNKPIGLVITECWIGKYVKRKGHDGPISCTASACLWALSNTKKPWQTLAGSWFSDRDTKQEYPGVWANSEQCVRLPVSLFFTPQSRSICARPKRKRQAFFRTDAYLIHSEIAFLETDKSMALKMDIGEKTDTTKAVHKHTTYTTWITELTIAEIYVLPGSLNFYNLSNPSSRTMALDFTQRLT